MKLIKVEAHGFKSFADPISLKFDGGVAGIIGPNGSGKSNINDAIKWVLGERSAKELRGDNMEDVIFAGSKTAKPMDRAEVTLTFDNRGGTSALPHDFITISRVLERGTGSNQYYLNGELCRQKDIKDIAMETGIGKSSLAIISQGTVSDIAEATAEERKAIFEEAAGVSKYKFRKKEALSKLEKTEHGLEKIRLVIAEIEKKLVPLRKQAEKAKVFIAKSEELKQVEVGLLVDNIQTFGKKFDELTVELEGVLETKNDLESRIESLSVKINQAEALKAEEEAELRKLSKELDAVKERHTSISMILARQNERHKLIASGEKAANLDEQIASYRALIESHGNRLKAVERDIIAIENRISENSQLIEDYHREINSVNISINKKTSELTKVETLLSSLKQQKESHGLLHKGTKTIIENKTLFGKALKGTVADLIKVDLEYVPAINAILANAIQNIVVDKSETAVKAVNFLKQNNGGRATFIPLASIQPKSVRDDLVLAIQGHTGFVGIANELVKVDVQYDILNKFLLGNVIVAADIESANSIANILERRYMVVTLEGDIIRAGGVITGGVQNNTQTILGLDEKIAELEKLIPGLRAAKHSFDAKLNEISNYRRSALELANEYKQQLHALKVKKASEQELFDEFNIKYKELANKTIELDNVELSVKSEEADLEVLQSQLIALDAQFKVKGETVARLSTEIKLFNNNRADFQTSLNKLNSSFAEKMTQKERSKLILEQSRERLSAQYKMTFESAQENFKLELNREQAEEIVRELREEIDALGSVNLESLQNLVEEENRYNELAENEKELAEAKDSLDAAIAEMDKIIINRLTNIVNDVNDEFNNVFRSMFGGGQAKLYFTDPKNILESGVEIEAQPPGKNIKNLKLFSGGEKSLIAISLLFGILKARPLPLCILDEVEAALDEANVVRYAEYLQQLKAKTQFLVITHRHGTMSRVDALFGATMQTRGVTSFFSLQLEEAKKISSRRTKRLWWIRKRI
ncbi:p115-like abc transporter ATP-binding protein [Mycoplasmopsis columbina SF7]|uniref:Chromosome partition protein Smc n=1 Tax=Mycoplasmopsis columbina SF7 TaxID=1037410 RepID=F9UK92_9BACT|nr:AAA family ATPase [Mycoplasmopsis columbina]EGV00097.1 p115-like abc transporter ATP-binding protein [Mycoplasmopsis columbina SF7]